MSGARTDGPVVLIPSYRSWANLERHLPAARAEAARVGGRVVVTDDASPDDTVARVRAAFPDVEVLTRERNAGFGGNCTGAIERLAGAELVFLCNSDVELLPGCLDPLLAALADPGVFAAGAVAVEPEGGRAWDGCKGLRLKRGLLKADDPDLEPLVRAGEPVPTLYAVGAHVLLRRAGFLELGGFDPLFAPFYWEDADLGYRAWKRGWRVLCVPAARVHHRREGGDIARTRGAARARHAIHTNRLLFTWKNLHDPRVFRRRHLGPLLGRVLTSWLLLDLRFYRALGAALGRLPEARAARRAARGEARLTDRELPRLRL